MKMVVEFVLGVVLGCGHETRRLCGCQNRQGCHVIDISERAKEDELLIDEVVRLKYKLLPLIRTHNVPKQQDFSV